MAWIKKRQAVVLIFLLFISWTAHASFIESTMGTAVVNDATAVYYNPAALVLLKNWQIIALNSDGNFRTRFTGQSIESITGFSQSGSSIIKTHYDIPSLYIAGPAKTKFALGIAVIFNSFNKDLDGNPLLRYALTNNTIKNVDVVPAIEFKLNQFFSLGAGVNISYANFLLLRTFGFHSLNFPDTQSRNECDGTGVGGDVGFLLKPSKSTIIGFNYRSSITYRLHGTSILEGDPELISNHYGFTFWTPARGTLSINQSLTSKIGLIGTIQRIGWSIFNEIHIHGIAAQIGLQPIILDARVPYHLRDTWLFTIGNYYNINPKLVFRFAGTYNQSPGNANFRICNGDSVILGTSVGYEIFKNIIIDAGYAHAFILNENINIDNLNKIDGYTKGSVDVFSVKLTFRLL